MKKKNDLVNKKNNIKNVALITAAILLVPLLGRWPWTIFDFIVMGTVIFGTGCLLDYVARNVDPKRRVYVAAAVLVLFFIVWAELAVGLVSQAVTGELWIYEKMGL